MLNSYCVLDSTSSADVHTLIMSKSCESKLNEEAYKAQTTPTISKNRMRSLLRTATPGTEK